MIPRPVRLAFLAVAAWAVLFAPGATGDGSRSLSEAAETSDQFAAAVIAPTFSTDSIVVGRTCRTDDDDCRSDNGHSAWTPVLPLALGLGPLTKLRHRRSPDRGRPAHRSETARGPPRA